MPPSLLLPNASMDKGGGRILWYIYVHVHVAASAVAGTHNYCNILQLGAPFTLANYKHGTSRIEIVRSKLARFFVVLHTVSCNRTDLALTMPSLF